MKTCQINNWNISSIIHIKIFVSRLWNQGLSCFASLAKTSKLLYRIIVVRYSSLSLSPTLNKNEKVKQYTRKKTHKSTVFFGLKVALFLYVYLAYISLL